MHFTSAWLPTIIDIINVNVSRDWFNRSVCWRVWSPGILPPWNFEQTLIIVWQFRQGHHPTVSRYDNDFSIINHCIWNCIIQGSVLYTLHSVRHGRRPQQDACIEQPESKLWAVILRMDDSIAVFFRSGCLNLLLEVLLIFSEKGCTLVGGIDRHRRDTIMFCRSFQITCVNRRQLEVKGEVSLKYEGWWCQCLWGEMGCGGELLTLTLQ